METTTQDINTLTIYELRRAVRRAVRRAGLGEDDIRKFGDLRYKRTWRLAYREFCTPRLSRLSDSDRDLLFGEVEFESDDTGQLLLEYNNYFEPPEPDDFSSLDDFYCQFRRWEQDFPDYAAALRRWAQLEVAVYARSVENRTPNITTDSRSPPMRRVS